MSYESIKYHETNGVSFKQTAILRTWVERDIIHDFNPEDGFAGQRDSSNGAAPVSQPQSDEKNWMVEAYMGLAGGDIWAVGDVHPIYKDAVCQDVAIELHSAGSTTHLVVTSTFAQPGNFSQVLYDSYQQTVTKNFDAYGALCEVRYDPQFAGGSALAGQSINFKVPFVAGIQIPQVLKSIRVIQYERYESGTPPADIAGSQYAVWNTATFRGFAPGTLLFVGSRSSSEGTGLYRTEYQFLYDSIRGFAYYYAVWVDARGLSPGGTNRVVPYAPGELVVPENPNVSNTPLQSIIFIGGQAGNEPIPQPSLGDKSKHNGASAFVMLVGVDFNNHFTGIRAPFGAKPGAY